MSDRPGEKLPFLEPTPISSQMLKPSSSDTSKSPSKRKKRIILEQPKDLSKEPVPSEDEDDADSESTFSDQGGPSDRIFSKKKGLGRLRHVDHVFIRQVAVAAEAIPLYNAPNSYELLDVAGELLFQVTEVSDFLTRTLCSHCGTNPFELAVTTLEGEEVLKIEGEPGCCNDKANAEVHNNATLYGDLVQIKGGKCTAPIYDVRDSQKNVIFKIQANKATSRKCCPMFGKTDFEIWSGLEEVEAGDRGEPIGRISKKWAGLLQEMFTSADNYGISFPAEMDLVQKSLLLAAVFLLDYEFFEGKG